MESSLKEETEDSGILLNQVNVEPFSVIEKDLHRTGS